MLILKRAHAQLKVCAYSTPPCLELQLYCPQYRNSSRPRIAPDLDIVHTIPNSTENKHRLKSLKHAQNAYFPRSVVFIYIKYVYIYVHTFSKVFQLQGMLNYLNYCTMYIYENNMILYTYIHIYIYIYVISFPLFVSVYVWSYS